MVTGKADPFLGKRSVRHPGSILVAFRKDVGVIWVVGCNIIMCMFVCMLLQSCLVKSELRLFEFSFIRVTVQFERKNEHHCCSHFSN